MITLRIQELTEVKGLTLEELSKQSEVSLQDIRAYTNLEILTDEIAENLKKIATQLNVPAIELVKPVVKRQALRLQILEMTQRKGLTLEKLSSCSGVHSALIAFYSTQPICQQKLLETSFQHNLKKITEVLDCSLEDIQVEAELPNTRMNLQNFSNETGLSLENLSQLTELPNEFIDLIDQEPMDISAFTKVIPKNILWRPIWCKICKCCIIADLSDS